MLFKRKQNVTNQLDENFILFFFSDMFHLFYSRHIWVKTIPN